MARPRICLERRASGTTADREDSHRAAAGPDAEVNDRLPAGWSGEHKAAAFLLGKQASNRCALWTHDADVATQLV